MKAAGAHPKGTLMGMEHALFSLARVGGPAAGIMLLKSHGITGLSATVSAVFFALYVVVRVYAPAPSDGGKKHGRKEK